MRRHRGCINLSIKLGLLAGLSASSIAMAADAPSVHVYNWYDYIGPNTLHDFQRDSGIQPVYDTFDSAEVLEGKLMTSRSGYDVVVASNFSLPTLIKAGALAPLPREQLPAWKNLDADLLARIFAEQDTQAIMHFAGSIVVPESVADPLKYYHNNTTKSRALIEAAVKAGVPHFIFSSTAATYGIPEVVPVREDAPKAPINPYGWSKLMTERMLADTAAAHAMNYCALRYFNVAGADPLGRSGQSTAGATHLIKVAVEAALGKRDGVAVFGTDYETPDGTGVRDYIHVVDLALGHLRALERLAALPGVTTLNLGTGRGYSVLEMVKAFEAASGCSVPYDIVDRRAGDVAACWADPSRARELLGWTAERDLRAMCEDAWRWQRNNPRGYAAD